MDSFCFVRPFQLAARKVRRWLRNDYESIPNETTSRDTVSIDIYINSRNNLTKSKAEEGVITEGRNQNREDAPLLPRRPTPTIAVRQPTIAEASTSSHGHAKTPSPTALTPGSSPGEYSDSSSFRSRDGTRRHSRASSKSSKVDKDSLKEKLRRARRESPRHPHMFFVPICNQDELITVQAVARDIQNGNDNITENEALKYANAACESAKQLYAVLAYIKKGADIGILLEENITDEALPLKRKDDDQGLFALERRDGQPIETFESWSEKEREKFDRIQWWMTSTVFEDKEHYDLDDKAILPFIRFKLEPDTQTPMQGGYSEVYPVRVHPAHHKFWKSDSEVRGNSVVSRFW